MTLRTALAPRSRAERLRVGARMLAERGTVAVSASDDGYEAACLQIAGSVPILAPGGDAEAVGSRLRTLGLGPVGAPLPSPPAGAPLVSIVICTFNRAELLPHAIASAKQQHWPVEIIVVDDGSTDETQAVLGALDGITVLRQEPNQGKPAALNRGLAAVSGEAVLVLDDDDWLFPGALTVLAHALFADPSSVAVLADTVQFRGEDGSVGDLGTALRVEPARMRSAVLQQVPSWPGATLVRTDAQRAVGAYHEALNMLEDMDMYLRLAHHGAVRCLPLPTLAYRLHPGPRGGAAERALKRDATEVRVARIQRSAPVFRERWEALAPQASRAEGFAWAQGLFLRGLRDDALAELSRWGPPWSLAETRTRRRLGLTAPEPRLRQHTVVLHDGEMGALSDVLDRVAGWAAPHVLPVVPRECPEALDVAVPHAVLAETVGLAAALPGAGPWVLRCSSDPAWVSPVLTDRRLIPTVEGVDGARVALLATALALGWPVPDRSRACLPPPEDPLLVTLQAAKDAARPQAALRRLLPVLEAHPGWKAAWRWAGRLAGAAGLDAEAALFASRGR